MVTLESVDEARSEALRLQEFASLTEDPLAKLQAREATLRFIDLEASYLMEGEEEDAN